MDKDTQDWLIEQHRESYRYQLQQRDKIYDRVSFLSSPLTLLGAGIIYVVANRPSNWNNVGILFFYAPIALSVCFFASALLFIIYVLIRGFRYGYAVTPRQLQDYATKLSEHSSKRPVADMDVLSKIKLNLSQQYCDAATHNANINYRRRNLILFAMKLTAIAFICFVLTLPAYFVGKLHDSAKPTEVIISKPIKITP